LNAAPTSRIVAGREKNTSGGPLLPDDVASRRSTQDTILTEQDLPNSISRSNLSNQLNDFRVIETPIASDDKEAALGALRNREQSARNESFAVVRLLEYSDLLSKPRPATYQS